MNRYTLYTQLELFFYGTHIIEHKRGKMNDVSLSNKKEKYRSSDGVPVK